MAIVEHRMSLTPPDLSAPKVLLDRNSWQGSFRPAVIDQLCHQGESYRHLLLSARTYCFAVCKNLLLCCLQKTSTRPTISCATVNIIPRLSAALESCIQLWQTSTTCAPRMRMSAFMQPGCACSSSRRRHSVAPLPAPPQLDLLPEEAATVGQPSSRYHLGRILSVLFCIRLHIEVYTDL